MENYQNIYDLKFAQSITSGLPTADAAILVTDAYLDGKPKQRGKSALKASDRNAAFWTCQFLWTLSAEVYETESFVLALARYIGQEQIANYELICHITQVVPEAVRQAIRYSGIVLRQSSERWKEIERLAAIETSELSEFVRICQTFDHAHRERIAEVETYRRPLTDLSPLELLIYASLYAFEHLLPQTCQQRQQDTDCNTQEIWDAINDILIWKLRTCTNDTFYLTDAIIGSSLHAHLLPFLSQELPKARAVTYQAFKQLITAQVELNSFLSLSIDAFCYDDSISFEFCGAGLEIIEHNPDARCKWERNGKKFARLHNYWFYRAIDEFIASGMAFKQIGSLENHESNQIAYIKATRTYLQLTQVYGLDEFLLAETGLRVDLFQALLSLELMTVFYSVDFILPYHKYLSETGNWRLALRRLAMEGLLKGLQNRFPITWSDRETKIKNIRPWTVSKKFPQGHAKAAEAILDFWTSDLSTLSAKLHSSTSAVIPQFYERPVLKMGRYLFQLPWMVAMQNNASAAINNLRRIGARRAEAGEETRRIEQQLANCFKEQGFHVQLNYQPARTIDDDPGEVDIICVRDGQLLVLEIKSTFLRRSMKDAWLHKATTLRKAGLQLRRKVEAVQIALTSDKELALTLGLNNDAGMPVVRGWIVDTSIEHDHELFSGFMKVTLEEILIALRDDRHLLNDPWELFSGSHTDFSDTMLSEDNHATSTLYPNGFSGNHFVQIIEQQAVWADEIENTKSTFA